MPSLKLIVIVIIALTLTACMTTKPIYNVTAKNPTSSTTTAPQVKKAIIEGAKYKGWSVKEEQPGKLILDIHVRDHYAQIEVPYSAKGYSINYVSSVNLDFDSNKIHRNYNKWIQMLEQRIDTLLSYE